MHTTIKLKPRFYIAVVFFTLLFLWIQPSLSVKANIQSVRVDTGATLESAIAGIQAQDEDFEPDKITRLAISGNGELTPEDGLFIREHLPEAHTLDLREFTGTCAPATFRGCSSLNSVLLPEHFVMSQELFYGCTMLDELLLPVHYQISKDSLAYCALDFSEEYPSLLNDGNVLSFAAHQRPKVYFTMPDGNHGSVMVGEVFRTPYELETRDGTSYQSLVQESPDWLLMRAEDIEVHTSIYYNDVLVNAVDTSQEGEYKIIYTLPYGTNANVHTQTYYLTILPEALSLSTLVEQANDLEEEHYTEESWHILQQALEAAPEDSGQNLSNTRQTLLASNLAEAMAQLELRLMGAQGDEIYVGQTFSLNPADGGSVNLENLTFDDSYFSATIENNDVVFTALKAGQSEIVYASPGGQQGTIALTILEGTPAQSTSSAETHPAEGEEHEEYPAWLWSTVLALLLFTVFILAIVWYHQKKLS